jgi:hypothetical protein
MDTDITKFLDNARIFRCVRLCADLSTTACARNFTSASAMACLGCPIGVRHSAIGAVGDQQMTTAKQKTWCIAEKCCRCGVSSVRRLVRGHTICVSCFNRESEVRRGVNSKGATPIKWACLRQACVTILEQRGNTQLFELVVASFAEAERTVARRWPGAKIFEFSLDSSPLRVIPRRSTLVALTAF